MAGMDMLVPMAFNIPVAIPAAGQMVLRAAVDGRAPRRHEIRVAQRSTPRLTTARRARSDGFAAPQGYPQS